MCNDLGFLAHLPELCDITFMVGQDKEPVCAVRAVLGRQKKTQIYLKIKYANVFQNKPSKSSYKLLKIEEDKMPN